MPARRAEAQRFSVNGWLSDLAGRTKNLLDEVTSADLVVMIATAGAECRGGGHHRRSLQRQSRDDHVAVVSSPAISDEVLSTTLAQLRPYSRMLVIASAEEYIEDMLAALRA